MYVCMYYVCMYVCMYVCIYLGGTTCSMLLVQWRRQSLMHFYACRRSFFKQRFRPLVKNIVSHMLEEGEGQAPDVNQAGLTRDKKCTQNRWQATATPDIMRGKSQDPASLTRHKHGCTHTINGRELRRPLAGMTCGVCPLRSGRSGKYSLRSKV
jgi:hypothetical protein